MRRDFSLLMVIVCLSIKVSAQDFRVENFRENLTDLTAATADIRDNNNVDGALLRFSVRDDKFEFEANLGILKQEKGVGEVRLYVPEGTKRITIRHPQLGILRGYMPSVPIQAKTTYDADIVITNRDYLMVLFGNKPEEAPGPEVIVPEHEVAIQHEDVMVTDSLNEQEQEASQNSFNYYAGIGYNLININGPSVQIGFRYKRISLEGGFVYGTDKIDNCQFYKKGTSTPFEAYDYQCNKFWARLGFDIGKKSLRLTPMAGLSFHMISGKSVSDITNYSNFLKESHPMAISLAIRFSIEAVNNIRLHITPDYEINQGNNQVFKVIKEADSKIKSWGEGFGINAGIIYEF